MSKDRQITDGQLPERVCPECGSQVYKMIRYGQLSYSCKDTPGKYSCGRWGPWDEAKPRSQSDSSQRDARMDAHHARGVNLSNPFVHDRNLIRGTRHAAGLTQSQAAKLVGYSLRTWQSWEAGMPPMRRSTYKYFKEAVRKKKE